MPQMDVDKDSDDDDDEGYQGTVETPDEDVVEEHDLVEDEPVPEPKGKPKKGEREAHTPQCFVYGSAFWLGQLHLCPPHEGRKNPYFNILPTTP